MCSFAVAVRNAWFLGHALEIFMILTDRTAGRRDRPVRRPAENGSPPLRAVLPHNSDIVQQVIVERVQILPSLPAPEPAIHCAQ
jgi:hypothetical protein